jgi:ATP-dependent Clp protease ATP-binding subunit ClpA
MNLEKFTDRAKGFLQAAQTVAIRLNHQRITPLHIAKALLEDSEGMAAGLIQRAGGVLAPAARRLAEVLAETPDDIHEEPAPTRRRPGGSPRQPSPRAPTSAAASRQRRRS